MHRTITSTLAIAGWLVCACGGDASVDIPDTAFGTTTPTASDTTQSAPNDAPEPDTPEPTGDADSSSDRPQPDAGPSPATCEAGQTKPCICDDGGSGLIACDTPGAVCDCATCPDAEPLSASGFLVTSAGQWLFDHGIVNLTHRSGALSGGAGCVVSATMTLAVGTPDAPGCALHLEASGAATPEGALPIVDLRFEADSACLGLGASDYGTYTMNEFAQGELLLTPGSVGGGADAECWVGQLTATLEGLMTRSDGHQLTLSTSQVEATGSGLSVGNDVLCPGVTVPVDLNDCAKEVPLFSDCNPYCQLGCDPGNHCVVDAGFFTCHPVGTLSFGDVCTGPGACGYGLSCFALPGSTVPVCQQTCISDDDCPETAQCAITANLGGGSDLSLCAFTHQDCDPLGQTGCGAGEACYFDGGSTLCWPGGALAEGDLCEGAAPNACAAGLHCLVICRTLCSTASEAPSCWGCGQGHHAIPSELSLGFCLGDPPPSLCDPYLQTGCEPGDGCYPVPGGVACREAGTIGYEMPCVGGDSCLPGFACVGGACRTLCDFHADASAVTSCDARCNQSVAVIEPVSWGIGICVDDP